MLVALAGVIVAALSTELNDAVSSILLGDIRGGLGMSRDSGIWFDSLYISGEVLGMAISPWFAVTFTLRRWTLGVIALTCVATLLVPTTTNLTLLYGLRTIEGMCGGLTIPLLMTTALRALPPPIRLYGLAAYGLTATFFPNLATAMAALWTQTGDGALGWHFAFYQAVPLAALAGVLVWYGMPDEPLKLERFAKFDWRGVLLVIVGFGSLSTMFEQGNRLDWFNSPTICVLGLLSALGIPALFVNEWFHELPLMRPQLLLRRNFAYGLIALISFLIINQSASTIPNEYLQLVQGFRPAQSYELTAMIAASQLLLLPLMGVILNYEWVDSRVMGFLGLVCVLTACIGDSFLTSVWQRDQFYLWQAFQALGAAMFVMPLLMTATNALVPQEGPLASSLFNAPRAVSEAAGAWLLQLVQRWRGGLHSNRLTDQLGQSRFRLAQAHGLLPQRVPGGGQPGGAGSLEQLAHGIQIQAAVLTLSDAFMIMGALTVALMVLVLVLPVRTYPPRIVFAKK